MRSVTHTDLWPFDKPQTLILGAYVSIFLAWAVVTIWIDSGGMR